jgi:uncharacterized protein (DUF1810 family)
MVRHLDLLRWVRVSLAACPAGRIRKPALGHSFEGSPDRCIRNVLAGHGEVPIVVTVPSVDLTRFADGYRSSYATALGELEGGRKRSHWMWYVFPQIAGLGLSPTAAHYAIADRAEAAAFLGDPQLGPGYRRLVDAVWAQVVSGGMTVRALFGAPDDQKLVSSLTLFAGIADDADDVGDPDWARFRTRAAAILDAAEAQGLPRCAATQRFLAAA